MPTPYDYAKVRDLALAGKHREAVGGMWDEIGRRSFDYLRSQGLRPDMRVVDIACGSLRVGVHLVEFLEQDHYFGLDLTTELLDAGFDIELRLAGLDHKLPRGHLVATNIFDFDLLPMAESFDIAFAQSLFTHTPLNDLRLCLTNLADRMLPGATFHATFFIVTAEQWRASVQHDPGGVTTYPSSNPYHYQLSDLQHAAAGLPWRVGEPFRWGHPRAQTMVVFERV